MINRTARFYHKQRWTFTKQRVAPEAISEFQDLDNSKQIFLYTIQKRKIPNRGEKQKTCFMINIFTFQSAENFSTGFLLVKMLLRGMEKKPIELMKSKQKM